MNKHTIGIVMNGVTGRMGANQHLVRSVLAIRDEGGVRLANGDVAIPDPILVGRNRDKVMALAAAHGVARVGASLEEALRDPYNRIYFDAQTTSQRAEAVRKAIAAGKAVYCEKPIALDTATAVALYRECAAAGLKNGVVQDKLAQRPSWNYRAEDGGGIAMDMLCHWRYVIDNLFGNVSAISCLCATHIPERRDEQGAPYRCTADDAAYATMRTDNGLVVQFNSSWCTRVRRDDLLTIHVDGTGGSAVAGLRDCWTQGAGETPRAVWNPDIEQPIKFFEGWRKMPQDPSPENAFKAQWELFLRHVVGDEPFRWTLLEGAKGVQLAEKGLESWRKGAWVGVDALG
ncbi:MAG: Gfo/Idh/MocA family oxidoreductase [Opitutaceae bacterium]